VVGALLDRSLASNLAATRLHTSPARGSHRKNKLSPRTRSETTCRIGIGPGEPIGLSCRTLISPSMTLADTSLSHATPRPARSGDQVSSRPGGRSRMPRRHVPALQSTLQGRQGTSPLSIMEDRRCAGGKVVQRAVLYLGEINDSQREAWCRVAEAFDEETGRPTQLTLFPADRSVPSHARGHGVQVRLGAMELHTPRQWGACWLACHLYEQFGLDRFLADRLAASREGASWHTSCRHWCAIG
jgi:hypothetical protein